MKTTKRLLVTSFALSILFTSCKKEEEEAIISNKPKEIILPRVQPIPVGNYVAPPVQQPIQTQQQTVINNQIVNQTPVVTKPGMNPPHGQPGHRCDIQVGAPLNSKPAPVPAPTGAAISKQITMPTPTTAPSSNNVPAILQPNANSTTGKNPPHGQEGHRCDIPVGADLSK